MDAEWKVECPDYNTGCCTIDSCPRYLDCSSVDYDEDGEIVGEGFCNEHGSRYFHNIPGDKVHSIDEGKSSGEGNKEDALPKVIVAGFTPEADAIIRDGLKSKGGRPRKSSLNAGHLTQKEVARIFSIACKHDKDAPDVVTEDMVSNWEAYSKHGVKRGAVPPSVTWQGMAVFYSAELRKNRTAENMAILQALAKQYDSTRHLKDSVNPRKAKHFKSPESLARENGTTQEYLSSQRNP